MIDDIKKYSHSGDIEKYMVEKLSEIVSIPSTIQNPELKKKVLSEFLRFSKNEGYDVENNDCYGSVLLYGSTKNLEIGIITHLDVVPAGEGWRYDPFRLTQCNELLIGRGTLDNKGPAVIALTAMNYFVKNNIRLPFSIRLFLGCEEENGMSDIQRFLSNHNAPDFSFTPDNVFPVCCGENGFSSIVISSDIGDDILSFVGKTVVNSSASYAKAVLAREPTAQVDRVSLPSYIQKHKNVVEAINTDPANVKPFNAIRALSEYLYNSDMVTGISKKALELILKLSDSFSNNVTNTYERMSSSDYLFFRCDSIRVENGQLVVKYQIRYTALKSFKNIIDYLETTLSSYNSSFTIINNHDGVVFNSNKNKITALLDSYKETTGFCSKSYFDDYGTYAAVMPNTVAFGAREPMPHTLLGYGCGNMHQKDEYIGIDEMKIALETYIRAIFKLSEIYKMEG